MKPLPWRKPPKKPKKPNPLARPKIVVRDAGRPVVAALRRPVWRKRLFTALAWLGGWCLLVLALVDLVGPLGWKLGVGGLLVAMGGVRPLLRVVRGGLVEYPPWDWFEEVE